MGMIPGLSASHIPPPPGMDQPPPPPPPPSTVPITATGTVASSATISRGEVRFDIDNLPTNEQDLSRALEQFDDEVIAQLEAEMEEEERQSAPRSTAPGQRGMAERYMASKGWKKGQGLGARRDGIRKALRLVKAKRSAARGMGHAGMGRFVGGK